MSICKFGCKVFNLTLILGLFQLNASFGQDTATLNKDTIGSKATIFQFLHDYQQLTITTNLDSLLSGNKRLKKQPATYLLEGENQPALKITGKLELRGRLRRKICALPPVKLHFNKKELASQDIKSAHNKLKLVTYCKEEENSQQYVLKEFWTYRLYNEISPKSFKVHQLQIIYVDENTPSRKIESIGYVIENNGEMAARLNGSLKEGMGVSKDSIHRNSYYENLLFQYMIGNTDWKTINQKNLKLIKIKGEPYYSIIPYDFDYSALVAAPYARVNPDYPEQKVLEDRVCMGKFDSEEYLQTTADHFLQAKDAILALYKKCPITDRTEKLNMTRYIKSFYRIANSPKRLKEIFLVEE